MSQPIRGQGGHLVFPIGSKNTNLVEGVEILLSVKFRWILFSGFRGEVENMKVYAGRTDGRTTDGRTDDGRCAMTIAHSSLRLRWAKNQEQTCWFLIWVCPLSRGLLKLKKSVLLWAVSAAWGSPVTSDLRVSVWSRRWLVEKMSVACDSRPSCPYKLSWPYNCCILLSGSWDIETWSESSIQNANSSWIEEKWTGIVLRKLFIRIDVSPNSAHVASHVAFWAILLWRHNSISIWRAIWLWRHNEKVCKQVRCWAFGDRAIATYSMALFHSSIKSHSTIKVGPIKLSKQCMKSIMLVTSCIHQSLDTVSPSKL